MHPNAFGRHEVLHTASIIAGLFDNEIFQHEALRDEPDLLAEAERLAEGLAAFYQACGARFLDDEGETVAAAD